MGAQKQASDEPTTHGDIVDARLVESFIKIIGVKRARKFLQSVELAADEEESLASRRLIRLANHDGESLAPARKVAAVKLRNIATLGRRILSDKGV